MVDEDPSHEVGGDAEEVRAALPVDVSLAGELEKGLVDERGGLQGVIPSLPGEIPGRERVQLVVHERNQTFEGRGTSGLPVPQQASDIRSGRLFRHRWLKGHSLRPPASPSKQAVSPSWRFWRVSDQGKHQVKEAPR